MRRASLASFFLCSFVSLPALAEEPGVGKPEDVTDSAPRPENDSSQSADEVDAPPAADGAPKASVTGRNEPMKVYLEETSAEPPSVEPRSAPVVVAPAPAPVSSTEERMRLADEIDYLEDERDDRYSLGGPIALMAVGGGLTLGGLLFLAQGAALKSAATVGGSSASVGADAGSTLMGLGVMGLGFGGGFLIGGGVWLSKRIEKRRPYNDQIEALDKQIDYYSALELKPMVENDSIGLALAGVF